MHHVDTHSDAGSDIVAHSRNDFADVGYYTLNYDMLEYERVERGKGEGGRRDIYVYIIDRKSVV